MGLWDKTSRKRNFEFWPVRRAGEIIHPERGCFLDVRSQNKNPQAGIGDDVAANTLIALLTYYAHHFIFSFTF